MVSEDDLRRVVDSFYARIREDAALGPVFNEAIADWDRHLKTLSAFWSSVMLTTGRYKGQPMVAHFPHADAMTPAAFGRWLELWRDTTDALLPPDEAAAMQEKAERIAHSLALGLEFRRTASNPAAVRMSAMRDVVAPST